MNNNHNKMGKVFTFSTENVDKKQTKFEEINHENLV
jgi:hypothetical protein